MILIGFMGAGKTTIGLEIAEQTQLPYQDMDHVIAKEQGMSISEIFKTKGETAFRELEHEKLKTITSEKAVIATGGGVILLKKNREFLRKHTAPVVYLETAPDVFLSRLKGCSSRPLIQAKSSEEILSTFAKREPYYVYCADFIVKTGRKEPSAIAKEIISLLK